MNIGKALDFVKDEIRSLEAAPVINGCEMTAEWADRLEIFNTIKAVLEGAKK